MLYPEPLPARLGRVAAGFSPPLAARLTSLALELHPDQAQRLLSLVVDVDDEVGNRAVETVPTEIPVLRARRHRRCRASGAGARSEHPAGECTHGNP